MRTVYIVFVCLSILTFCAAKNRRNRPLIRNDSDHLLTMFGSVRRTNGRKAGKRGNEHNSWRNGNYPGYPQHKSVFEQDLRVQSQDEEKRVMKHQIDEIRKILAKLFEEKQKGLPNKSASNQYKFGPSAYDGWYPAQHRLHRNF